MRSSARSVVVAGVLLLVGVVTWAAADRVVVEDWTRVALGTTGIPPEWTGQNWGSPSYEFTVVDNDGHRALHLKSRGEGSTISRDIKGKVHLQDTPVLEWSWKVVTLPRNANSCRKATDDEAAQVYVAWPRFPEAVRSRIIGYVWDTTAPVGTICKSEKTGTVTYIVVRSGEAGLGQWITESRNVREDFKKVYGQEPDDPAALSISIDSNDTKSVAESLVGPILFRRP
jgi:hypothetical protein